LILSLVGMPGSGKSTVGRSLARRLALPFHDSDHLIEQRLGCSIREYFAREGEDAFRDVEEQVLRALAQGPSAVVATGGGAVLRRPRARRCGRAGRSSTCAPRPRSCTGGCGTTRKRPLLQVADPMARLRALHAERDPLYREAAHFHIETGRPSVPTLVNMIVMQLELAGVLPPHP
jgi:shikimate kinase